MVVRDQALLERISRDAQSHMLATMPASTRSDHFKSMLADDAFHISHQAPALILISAVAQDPWSIEGCALAAQNLMLAAHAGGLGTCWIGFAQGFLDTPGGKSVLGLLKSAATRKSMQDARPSRFNFLMSPRTTR